MASATGERRSASGAARTAAARASTTHAAARVRQSVREIARLGQHRQRRRAAPHHRAHERARARTAPAPRGSQRPRRARPPAARPSPAPTASTHAQGAISGRSDAASPASTRRHARAREPRARRNVASARRDAVSMPLTAYAATGTESASTASAADAGPRRRPPRPARWRAPASAARSDPRDQPQRLRAPEHRQRVRPGERREDQRPRQRRDAVGDRAARVEAPAHPRGDVPRVAHRDERVVDGEAPHPRAPGTQPPERSQRPLSATARRCPIRGMSRRKVRPSGSRFLRFDVAALARRSAPVASPSPTPPELDRPNALRDRRRPAPLGRRQRRPAAAVRRPGSPPGSPRAPRAPAREVLDVFVDGANVTARDPRDPRRVRRCATWRSRWSTSAARPRAKATVRFYDEPWEICVERFGADRVPERLPRRHRARWSPSTTAPCPSTRSSPPRAMPSSASCRRGPRAHRDRRAPRAASAADAAARRRPAAAGRDGVPVPEPVPVVVELERDAPLSFGAEFAMRERPDARRGSRDGADDRGARAPTCTPCSFAAGCAPRSAGARSTSASATRCSSPSALELARRAFDAWERGPRPCTRAARPPGSSSASASPPDGELALTLGGDAGRRAPRRPHLPGARRRRRARGGARLRSVARSRGPAPRPLPGREPAPRRAAPRPARVDRGPPRGEPGRLEGQPDPRAVPRVRRGPRRVPARPAAASLSDGAPALRLALARHRPGDRSSRDLPLRRPHRRRRRRARCGRSTGRTGSVLWRVGRHARHERRHPRRASRALAPDGSDLASTTSERRDHAARSHRAARRRPRGRRGRAPARPPQARRRHGGRAPPGRHRSRRAASCAGAGPGVAAQAHAPERCARGRPA